MAKGIEKIITIADKKYTLTSTLDCMETLEEVYPSLNEVLNGKEVKLQIKDIISMKKNAYKLFYSLLKVKHSNIDIDKAKEIYETLISEMENEIIVVNELIEFASQSFMGAKGGARKSIWN